MKVEGAEQEMTPAPGHPRVLDLYHYRNSVCSEKVRMVLFEKRLDWASHEVDIFRGENYRPEYLRLNPKAVVPTLVHDGEVLRESSLICEYLDDVFPEPPLKPASPAARARMRIWTKACDESLHHSTTALSFATAFRDVLAEMPEAERAARFGRLVDLERRDRQRTTYELGTEAPHVTFAVAAFERFFADLEAVFADGRPWLLGDRYTLAEVNIAPYLARLELMDLLGVWADERPATTAWWARVTARPGYGECIATLPEHERARMQAAGGRARPALAERRLAYRRDVAAARSLAAP